MPCVRSPDRRKRARAKAFLHCSYGVGIAGDMHEPAGAGPHDTCGSERRGNAGRYSKVLWHRARTDLIAQDPGMTPAKLLQLRAGYAHARLLESSALARNGIGAGGAEGAVMWRAGAGTGGASLGRCSGGLGTGGKQREGQHQHR
jgi:hypothetical protein